MLSKIGKIQFRILAGVAIAGIIAGLFWARGMGLANSIDSTKKYSYGGKTGWANFKSTNGKTTVSAGSLTGWVWTESTGWINLNSHATYNPSGVTIDGSGNVSGFAWGEKVGWIKFNSTNGKTSIDSNGNFSGYAWGESIGWIKFTPDANNYIGVIALDNFTLSEATTSPAGYAGANVAETITITAKNWKGNTDASYSPTTSVSVTATGSPTINPSSLTAANFSSGVATTQITWTSANTYNVIATDQSKTDITGSSSPIVVDATAPSAPGTPADAGTYWTTSSSLTWTWTASTDAESGIQNYYLCIGTTSGGTEAVNDLNVGNVTNYTWASAVNGNTYYAKVKARNNAGLTGSYSGNSDGILVDTTAPGAFSNTVAEGTNPAYQYQTGTTLYYNSNYTGDFTVSCSPTDSESGIQKVNFPSLGTGFTGGGDDAISPYSTTYSWTTAATSSQLWSTTAYNNAGLTTTSGFTVTNDPDASSGGSISYTDGVYATPSVSITLDAGIDASGFASRILQRQEASWNDETLGTFSAFSNLATDPASPYTDSTVVKGKSYKYRYVVTDNVGNSATWTSGNIARCGIRVSAPNGSETWTYSETTNITWTGLNNTVIPNVKIKLSTDGGSTYPTTLISSTANDGQYEYLVGAMSEEISDTCKIRIEDALNTAIYDTSNANFYLKGKLTVTAPTTAVEWTMGTSQNIAWVTSGAVSDVKLTYSTNSGSTYPNTIVASTINTGTYPWTVPLDPSSTVRVKVANAADETSFDVSDVDFVIKGVKVTAPNTAVTWTVGDSQNITWTYAGTIPNVKVEYATDGGTNYTSITNSTSNTATYSWTVDGDAIGTQARIRVSDASAPTVIRDASDANFIIKGINLTSPDGGESWTVGTAYNIAWTTSGITGNVKLEYSTNAGSTYTSFVDSTSDDGTYSWTVPGEAIGAQVRIRASNVTTSSIADASNANFTVNGLKIISPNGGEAWNVGSNQSITWQTQGTITPIKLEYSTDGGSTYSGTITSSTTNNNSYSWTIPIEAASAQARVRVSSVNDSTIADASNADLTIKGVRVTAPNGGQTWTVNSTQDITWTYAGSITNVKIEYYNAGWTIVQESEGTVNDGVVTCDGTFNWTIPDAIGTDRSVKITDNADSALTDTSDANFTIKGVLTLQSPNGDENWVSGSSQPITWTTVGTIANVKLMYSMDSGANYSYTIIASTDNDGSYDWTIPANLTTLARAKVYDVNGLAIEGESAADFTIGGITVTSPNGAENWTVGTTHDIAWTWAGWASPAAFRLDYSTDGGANYTLITSNTGNVTGTYAWTIPDAIDTDIIVKVSKFGALTTNDASDAVFTIVAPLITGVTVSPPSGETEYFVSDTASISWTWVGSLKTAIEVTYSTDDTNWTVCEGPDGTAAALSTSATSFSWTIPANAQDATVRVKVEDTGRRASSRAYSTSPGDYFEVKAQPSITISAPTGTLDWRVGKGYAITWTGSDGIHSGQVRVRVNTGNMGWIILSSTESAGASVTSLTWTVPQEALASTDWTTSGQIEITDVTRNSATGSGPSLVNVTSTAGFNVTKPVITGISPTSSDYWVYGGANQTIGWSTDGGVDYVKIYYDPAGAASWTLLNTSANWSVANTSNSTTTFSWTIPNNIGSTQIRIEDASRSTQVKWTSDAFNIIGVISGTTPDSLVANDPWTVTWNSTGTFSPVRLQLSSNGTNWYEMEYDDESTDGSYSTDATNSGSYALTVPTKAVGAGNTVNTNCKIRIYDPDYYPAHGRVIWTSDAFNIGPEPTLTIDAPATGTSWRVGSAGNTISWTASENATDNIEVSYSWTTNLNETWTVIASGKTRGYPTAASYSWTIPQAILDAGDSQATRYIKIRDTGRILTQMEHSPRQITILPPLLTVGDPSTSSYLVVGETPTISWASDGGEGSATFTVAIKYYSTPDTSYQNIETGYASNANTTTSYTAWEVPNKAGLSRIQVYDTNRSTTATDTSVDFTICGKFDSANITWTEATVGTAKTISWTTTGRIDSSDIELLYYKSADGFGTAVAIPSGDISNWTIAAGSGSCTWNIPTTVAATYINADLKIRVRDARTYNASRAGSYADTSSTFQIKGTFGSVTPTSTSQSWTVGASKTISWNPTGNMSKVKIKYSTNVSAGTPTWTLLDASANWSVNVDATYPWAVADAISSDCKIKVEDAYDDTVSATSQAFSIVGTVNLTAPDTTLNWTIGTTNNITWTTTAGLGSMANVKLEYSTNSGSGWTTVVESEGTTNDGIVTNDGLFAWLIPSVASNTTNPCLVRVSEENGLSNTDTSAAVFTMPSPVITFIQPGSAQNDLGSLTINEAYSVSWTIVGKIASSVKIEVSYDNAATWTAVQETEGTSNDGIVDNASDQLFSWTPAQTTLDRQCYLRITEQATTHVAAVASTSAFTVKTTPGITITAPSGNDWIMGNNYTIAWTSAGVVHNNLTIDYTLDGSAGTPAWVNIVTGETNDNAYSWTIGTLASTLSNQANAKIRITDADKSTTVGTASYFTIAIPTITVSRPAGGEVWAQGDSAPILWTYSGAVIGPLALQYDTGAASWPSIATGVTKTGETANSYSYNWTVPAVASSTVTVRIIDSPNRPNSTDDSLTFTIISAPTITVSAPASASEHIVEDPMTISWSVRGLSISTVAIDYWDDTNSNGIIDGTEAVAEVISASSSRGSSDTADAYSGKYTGSYTWTIPASATASSTLKMRIRGYDSGGSLKATAYSPEHFRIKGGFVFRDETNTSIALPTSTQWTANTAHSIKWYNRGTFPTVKLEYKTATTLDGLGVASWAAVSNSYTNTPVSGISSYSWTVPDPNVANLPTEPPEYYYVQLRVSSTADVTVYATSNAFKITYHTITWWIKDDETMSLLSSLGVRSTVGSTIYWNVATGDLTTAADSRYSGTTYPHRYPAGTYTTIWSKTGYHDMTDADRTISASATVDVLMESTTPKEYRVQHGFSYNEDTDVLMIRTWLEKRGYLVRDDSVNILGTATVTVYYGNSILWTATDTAVDSNTGSYYFEVANATVAAASGGGGLESGKTYFADCKISYGGLTGTRSNYSAGATFDITIAKKLKELSEKIETEVAGIGTTVSAQGSLTRTAVTSAQSAIVSEVESEAASTRTSVAGVKTETAQILTATGTESLATKISDVKTSVVNEVKPFVQSGILNRENAVKSGDTIVISYRTTTGLSPTIDVYNSSNVKKVAGKIMVEKGTTGIYEYSVKFLSAWGTGEFTVVCSESTKGTVDALTISVYSTDLETVAGQVSAVLGSTSGITGLKSVADTLNSQFNLVDQALSKLSQSLTGKAEQAQGVLSQVESVYKQLEEISAQIEKMSGAGGVNLKKLYEVTKEKKDDLVYIKNKTEELKAAMEINQKMLESTSKKPIVQTWFEFK